MKHKKLLLIFLLVFLVTAGAAVLLTSSSTSLLYVEKSSSDSVEVSYLYLDEERTYTFEIDAMTYGCVEVETNGGCYTLEVLDAAGEYIYDDASVGGCTYIFASETDVTIRLDLIEHSGGFRIWFSDEPIY